MRVRTYVLLIALAVSSVGSVARADEVEHLAPPFEQAHDGDTHCQGSDPALVCRADANAVLSGSLMAEAEVGSAEGDLVPRRGRASAAAELQVQHAIPSSSAVRYVVRYRINEADADIRGLLSLRSEVSAYAAAYLALSVEHPLCDEICSSFDFDLLAFHGDSAPKGTQGTLTADMGRYDGQAVPAGAVRVRVRLVADARLGSVAPDVGRAFAHATVEILDVTAQVDPAGDEEPHPCDVDPSCGDTGVGLGTQVTDASPFADDCGDDTDTFYPNSEVEVSAAVSPLDPDHIVAAWQQDRHADNGGARGIGVGYSVDGGATWETSALQGLAGCDGGPWRRATDPWVSIGGDGVVYVMTLGYNADVMYPPPVRSGIIFGAGGAFVHRSEDGGQTWEGPFTMALSPGIVFHDKNTITADPNIPGRVYATWQTFPSGHVFTRSDDGGRTWLPPIPLAGGGTGDQVTVLDDGTLVHIGGWGTVRSMTSRDGGLTWSRPVTVGFCSAYEGPPNIRAGTCIPSVATDGTNVYLSWTDQMDVVLASSADAGATWTLNAREVPYNSRFSSAVNVTAAGTIGIISYELFAGRYDRVRLMLATSEDGGQTWSERPVTDTFDLTRAPYSRFRGYFLGDYMALQRSGDDLVAVYTAVPPGNEEFVSNVYAQRLSTTASSG